MRQEHYEITRSGTRAAFARRLGRDDCERILEETLAEEKATDAERKVNQRAAAE
jgi:ferritin-like metal-binding protein YciE